MVVLVPAQLRPPCHAPHSVLTAQLLTQCQLDDASCLLDTSIRRGQRIQHQDAGRSLWSEQAERSSMASHFFVVIKSHAVAHINLLVFLLVAILLGALQRNDCLADVNHARREALRQGGTMATATRRQGAESIIKSIGAALLQAAV